MIIRAITPGDVEAVSGILAASPQAAQWPMRELAQPVWPNSQLWVAEADGAIVGMAAARTAADEAEILNLAVAPGWRRRGIARRLIEQAMETSRAAGARKFFLEVRESNAGARAFYAGLRFVETGRRRNYYRDPLEDALVLTRLSD